MKNKNWNTSDWQGRSKEQVESNYRILDNILKISTIVFFIWVISEITQNVIQ